MRQNSHSCLYSNASYYSVKHIYRCKRNYDIWTKNGPNQSHWSVQNTIPFTSESNAVYSINNDPNILYKHFLSTFMYHFELAFPLVNYRDKEHGNKKWVSPGIMISSRRKTEFHRLSKLSNDINFTNYVKKYKCIFKRVVQTAKMKFYDEQILHSINITKDAWSVVKKENNVRKQDFEINSIKISKRILKHPTKIADAFNDFFS